LVSVSGSFWECHAALLARRIPCPDCSHPLRPRGFSLPAKKVRGAEDTEGLGPGGVRVRSYCDACDRGHTLLPAELAAHRADAAGVLGEAAEMHAGQGRTAGQVAAALGRPARTVAGWLAQARAFAVAHLPSFTALLASLGTCDTDIPVTGASDPVRELLTVLRAISEKAASRWSDSGIGEWERINLICRGRFLSASLSSSFYPRLAYWQMA
jgi:hypothetical protein